ncbi:MAG: 50S ribosome-binding GTPase [Clostridia bacterium]|nr:50S ribosome-binding GTPase [Clostridia bacterium]MBR0443840.1 50S ribosome-binding GTPase [Clostridia bacterium]
MEKGNVLVIGNSGVGKSTLINSVLGEEAARTDWGTHGTTTRLEIYESAGGQVPFRVIDTIGFEPNYFKERRAINAVKKWSRDCAREGGENNRIDVIWFCVDGTRSKLFAEDIRRMTRAVSMWKSVPVIAVITKSYSVPDREKNVEMVRKAFAGQKQFRDNLKDIIPVVAQIYTINDTAYAPPDGIAQLIDATNALMPEGRRAASHDLAEFVLKRKRVLAQSVVGAATAGAVVVGAVPLPIPDGVILTPTEAMEVNSLAKIYGIDGKDGSKRFLNSIIEAGTVGLAAKSIITILKGIPGINIAASALNAIIAGVIVAVIGETSIYAFEQVFLGKKSVEDTDWIKKIIESRIAETVTEKAKPILQNLSSSSDKKELQQAVLDLVRVLIGRQQDSDGGSGKDRQA